MGLDPLVGERMMDFDSSTPATPSVTRLTDYAPPSYRVE
jgi:hypothetical protein